MTQAACVMRIGGSTQGTFGHGGKPREATPPEAPKSRALTVISAQAPREVPTPLTRGDSAFLAHLIATKEKAPQTREKRRAEPEQVIAAYLSAARLA